MKVRPSWLRRVFIVAAIVTASAGAALAMSPAAQARAEDPVTLAGVPYCSSDHPAIEWILTNNTDTPVQITAVTADPAGDALTEIVVGTWIPVAGGDNPAGQILDGQVFPDGTQSASLSVTVMVAGQPVPLTKSVPSLLICGDGDGEDPPSTATTTPTTTPTDPPSSSSSAPTTEPVLPVTGNGAGPLALIGLSLVVGGVAMFAGLTLWRRRSDRIAASD